METDIKNYIEHRIPELKDCLYPVFTTDLSKLTIAYTFSSVSGGHVKQSQLELKIIDEDYDVCKEMEGKINNILDMEEDEGFKKNGNTYFHSEITGGGVLFNDGCQRWENTLIYIIDWR